MNGSASMYARPRPRFGAWSTRAPFASAISAVLSVDDVDDEHLAHHARLLHPFETPVDEVADGELLVQRRDDDGELGIGDVVRRDLEAKRGIGRNGERGVGPTLVLGRARLVRGDHQRAHRRRAIWTIWNPRRLGHASQSFDSIGSTAFW